MEIKDILNEVSERDIRFVRLWFTDSLGQLKGFIITSRELERALNEGMGFDGSSIEGFARIYESDLVAFPDKDTFQVLPWTGDEQRTARIFCDILTPDGSPYPGDPRYVLKQNLEKAHALGYEYMVGPELEYFYFKGDTSCELLDEGGYFDLLPLDVEHNLRQRTVSTLEAMNIPVEYSHHEVSPSQHEIDLRYCDALKMADNIMTYRVVVKQIARNDGFYATFMPKPIYGVNGNGMHVHQSLFDGKRNVFFDQKDKYHLSDIGKHFIAGLLGLVKEFTAITNQWVNSYKRLVAGYEAPVYICWGQMNRSALVRVPRYKPGKENSTRVELRSPDPACNPYLAFSVMLASGLKGIQEKLSLCQPTEHDVYKMSVKEKESAVVDELPGSLIEAIQCAQKSSIVREALGDHVFSKFIENKKIEWENYRIRVSDYELKTYLPLL